MYKSFLVNVQQSSSHRAFHARHMSAAWAEATFERASEPLLGPSPGFGAVWAGISSERLLNPSCDWLKRLICPFVR